MVNRGRTGFLVECVSIALLLVAFCTTTATCRTQVRSDHSRRHEKGANSLKSWLSSKLPSRSPSSPPAPTSSSNDKLGHLKHVELEKSIAADFAKLTDAMMSSDFLAEDVFRASCGYKNISIGSWQAPSDSGRTGPADGRSSKSGDGNNDGGSSSSMIGATRETSYLMPRSMFSGPYMAYQTQKLLANDDNRFVIRFRTKTPDAPFGRKFVAWTQVELYSQDESVRMVCSVEPEYPNGKPMPIIANKIRSGMRKGTAKYFRTLSKCMEDRFG